jgi:hypothetical protein
MIDGWSCISFNPDTVINTAMIIFDDKNTNRNQIRKDKMNNTTKLIIIGTAIAAAFSGLNAFAERNYDPKTVETAQGKVLSVEKTQQRGGGVHFMLQTEKETIAVHLGPSRYIEKQTPKIETNDTVTVTGSRVTVGGGPAIIAAQVKKGNEILKLRDENGTPVCRHGGRRKK